MGNIAQKKIDNLTLKCLKDDYFTSVADSGMREDSNVIKYGMSKNLKFGLWASSMSNSYKNSKIEFKSLGISIVLPKQIAMKCKIPLSCQCIQYIYYFYSYYNK